MRLPHSFYARSALEVAPELLGKELRHGPVRLRITEVEAYTEDDTACHAYKGRTARTEVLFGPPGRAYVYLCYGIHQMLNIVTDPARAAAVLIRACEPLGGLPTIRERRGGMEGPVLLTGPGKVGQALGVDTSFSGHVLHRPGGLELHEGEPPAAMLTGPRVGIDYADPVDRDAPWRFAAAGTRWVSRPKGLQATSSSTKRRTKRRQRSS